ncbi:MAG: disulfide bond formation protein B [Candidatus Moranbacteria bacterium]|nr:disulfide bond formation protein B [Candidatus Moranbacteria bacterium]
MKKLLNTLLTDHSLRSWVVFLGCVLLLGTGYFLQYRVGLIPCPLCILQRFFFALVGITALAIAIRKPSAQELTLLSYAMLACSFFGGALAARQIWLQHNPPSLLGASCVPGLASITNLIASIFKATADCAEKGWTLLSLSIPEWSLIAFVVLAVISTIPLWKKD